MDVIRLATAKGDNSHGPRRSTPGQGQQCFIHVIGRADEYADSIVGGYGQISAGCGPNLGEDFSETIWPVVIKVLPHVVEGDLIQHLRDLADSLEKHTKPEDMQRTLAEGWQQREGDWILPIDPDPITGINFAPLGGDVVNIATWRNLPKSTAEHKNEMRTLNDDGSTEGNVGNKTWPASGHQMTGQELTALCKASGRSTRSFALYIGIDGRKLRTKRLIDFSGDIAAAGAIDQMRAEVSPPA